MEKLLADREDIKRADSRLPDHARDYIDKNGDLFIPQGMDGMDGFYAAKMVSANL